MKILARILAGIRDTGVSSWVSVSILAGGRLESSLTLRGGRGREYFWGGARRREVCWRVSATKVS